MNNLIQRKTTMLLYQIEQSIGNFVLENGDINFLNLGRLESIHKREVDKGRGFNRDSIKDIVEATYLDELFGFALDIASDSSMLDSLNYLYSLFHHLDIYEVRNAIAHPNRPFWDCYWYRVASIASDPVIELLRLNGVKEALESAETGTIDEPPEEWINKTLWQIPNNLPYHFDHGVTGLIGRTKELKDLKRYIANPRVNSIALVAPGGLGKTALALDLLNTIVSTPSFSVNLDAVIFITMKTEKLTSDGVVSLDSIETIEELRINIVESVNDAFDEDYANFDEVIKTLENKKILLCVDNLETLLREDQSSFEELNYQLPALWKVLVTSRIIISNSTIVSLDSLKESSATILARTYHTKRGGQSLNQDEYIQIAKKCFYNPLAIRLSIDLMMSGKDIPNSLNVANREIAEFSYNNLINALSKESVEILEAIFVESTSTRLSLCELLDYSMDQVSEAIGELSRTSLITRESTDLGELYLLSNSVRELLLISPRNIEFRHQVIDRINRLRNLANEIDIRQSQKELAEWHTDYIPSETNSNLKILVTEVNKKIKKARKNTEIAVHLFRKLSQAEFIYEKDYLYHQSMGRVYEVLKDFNSAIRKYELAINCDKDNPSSYYLLARLYHNMNNFDKAREEYEKLIDMGWTSEKSIVFGKTIYTGYFLSLLYAGRYEEVLEKTKIWKDSGAYRSTLGTFRASAWKRKMENLVEDNPDGTVDALKRSSTILSDVFRNDGYSKTTCSQAIKVFEEIEFCFSRPQYRENYYQDAIELFSFVKDNIYEVKQIVNPNGFEDLISKFNEIPLKNSPFKDINKRSAESSQFNFSEEADKVNSYGLIEVKIKNRPKDRATFLFACDVYFQDYFLHFDKLKDGKWKDWCHLEIGQTLNILPEEDNIEGKAITAREVYIEVN